MITLSDIKKSIEKALSDRKKQKESDALYDRLHKHDGVKFTQKDHVKNLRDMKKAQLKKNRDAKPKKEDDDD